MHRVVEYTLIFLVLVLLQVFLFDNLNLSPYLYPLVYVGFIILLPVGLHPAWTLLLGFLVGAVTDLLSGTPVYPSAETVARRLAQPDTEKGWSGAYQQPYAVYTTEDGGRYFLWYQDSASVEAATRAAKLLGVAGASVWRLGMLPDSEVWNWDSLLG